MYKNNNLVIGGYYNSIHYGGKNGNRFGGWIGTELPIVNKLHLVAESIIGYNALSYTSFGIIYYPKKESPLLWGFKFQILKLTPIQLYSKLLLCLN